MKKLYLMKNPELFQGEKKIKKNKNYFEGWYFKNTTNKTGISFIPGINISKKEKKAFIQIITTDSSYFVSYNINDFEFSHEPFYIKIGNNLFSKNYLHININDNKQNLKIYGDIKYSGSININTNFLTPNIMGPFSYIAFMECNHAILSMKTKANGQITINNKEINFNDDTGYIEKDFGCSFPKSYIWCQGNNFKNKDTAFMLSIANVPFKIFNFRGLICSLLIDNKEYRFATYNNTKLIKCVTENNSLNITLQKGIYTLDIKSKFTKGQKLTAPIKGEMTKTILESISETITIMLKKDNKIIFSDTSMNCGLEIVKEE